MNVGIFCITTLSLIVNSHAWARPEFSLRAKLNCTGCHVLPQGAGPRNAFGKAFGSRSHGAQKTSATDWYYGDFRTEFSRPFENPRNSKNGFTLIDGAASANFKFLENPLYNLSYLGTFDMGTISSGAREQTLLWTKTAGAEYLPDQILVGKFYLPFGLLTDDPRTYTKKQTRTTLRHFDAGLNISWDFLQASHLDLSLTNGFQSAGAGSTNDVTMAYTGNLRLNPPGPVFYGLSYSHHESEKKPDGISYSLYSGLDFNILTKGKFNSSLTGELVSGKGWNDPTINDQVNFFTTDAAYLSTVKDKESRGYYALWKLALVDIFTVFVKADSFAFDKDQPKNRFERLGYGINWQFDSNIFVIIRYDDTKVHGTVDDPNTGSSQDMIVINLRAWI